jgi:hypothetical protein
VAKASPRQKLLAQLRAESAACVRHHERVSLYTAPELWGLYQLVEECHGDGYIVYKGVRFRVSSCAWARFALDPETRQPLALAAL